MNSASQPANVISLLEWVQRVFAGSGNDRVLSTQPNDIIQERRSGPSVLVVLVQEPSATDIASWLQQEPQSNATTPNPLAARIDGMTQETTQAVAIRAAAEADVALVLSFIQASWPDYGDLVAEVTATEDDGLRGAIWSGNRWLR